MAPGLPGMRSASTAARAARSPHCAVAAAPCTARQSETERGLWQHAQHTSRMTCSSDAPSALRTVQAPHEKKSRPLAAHASAPASAQAALELASRGCPQQSRAGALGAATGAACARSTTSISSSSLLMSTGARLTSGDASSAMGTASESEGLTATACVFPTMHKSSSSSMTVAMLLPDARSLLAGATLLPSLRALMTRRSSHATAGADYAVLAMQPFHRHERLRLRRSVTGGGARGLQRAPNGLAHQTSGFSTLRDTEHFAAREARACKSEILFRPRHTIVPSACACRLRGRT